MSSGGRATTTSDDVDAEMRREASARHASSRKKVVNEKLEDIEDVTRREWFILATLAVFTILLGVYPSLITDITSVSVENLIGEFNADLAKVEAN